MSRSSNLVKRLIAASAVALARLGIIDEHRGRRTADLAWPRVVTGLARMSQRVADFAMVGLVLGPAAIAGMGFAMTYWAVAMGVGFSMANGAIALISQRYGAGDHAGLDLAVKQLIWLELGFAALITLLGYFLATDLIAVLGASPASTGYGAVYLQVVALSMIPEFLNKVGSRTLVGADDSWSPMLIRAGGAICNLVLNAIFIFGLGLGVFGAALGTLIATIGVAVTFGVGLYAGRLPWIGRLPVRLSLSGPYFDRELMAQLVEITFPLLIRRLVSRGARIPMLAIVAQFGTVVVAGYVISRQIRGLMGTPGWGFGTAATSLVGQELGADDEGEAEAYGWDVLKFAFVVYAVIGVLAFVLAPQIAGLFSSDPATVAETVPFVRVAAVSLLGLGIDSPASGALSGGGDTRWPLYARLLGLYVFMIPLAYLGTVTSLGITAVYGALIAETVTPGLITYYRFRTGAWKAVSRKYRPATSD